MPSVSATSFWVCSVSWLRPKRSSMMRRSRGDSRPTAPRRAARSALRSSSSPTCGSSLVSTSISSSSLPSVSVFSGSSMLASCRRFELLRRYIKISFSIHRLA